MSEQIINLLITGTLDTLQMTIISTIMAMLLGIPLGVVLVVTSKGHILENVALNKVLGAIVNATRSVPFIILMVAIIPFTRMVVGTSIGTTAACVPLTIAAIPFLARLVETSIKDINFGVIEAAQSMGASPLQIIWKVLLPEALPTIIDNVTVLIVNLISYSAMAGAIGGGGLGDIAIRYGYQRFQADIMIATIIILVILVVTSKGHILENVALNKVLGAIVNATRSIPFIILMVAIIPFTRIVAGTSIGTTAACVPLTIAAIPFLARLVETSIKDINFGVIEAAQSMGASPLQIIWKVLLPEALPTIIDNVTVLIVNLISYSAMAGAIGGGGLGDIAIRYGYQRFQADIMIATIIILVILVQLVQMIGDAWSKAMNKK